MAQRNMVNPHDKITIDDSDIDAARAAVLIVGEGAYCIEGDAMPLFILGGADKWFMDTYGQEIGAWLNSITTDRLAAALESMTLHGERSSMSDPVGRAHKMAAKLREKQQPQPADQ